MTEWIKREFPYLHGEIRAFESIYAQAAILTVMKADHIMFRSEISPLRIAGKETFQDFSYEHLSYFSNLLYVDEDVTWFVLSQALIGALNQVVFGLLRWMAEKVGQYRLHMLWLSKAAEDIVGKGTLAKSEDEVASAEDDISMDTEEANEQSNVPREQQCRGYHRATDQFLLDFTDFASTLLAAYTDQFDCDSVAHLVATNQEINTNLLNFVSQRFGHSGGYKNMCCCPSQEAYDTAIEQAFEFFLLHQRYMMNPITYLVELGYEPYKSKQPNIPQSENRTDPPPIYFRYPLVDERQLQEQSKNNALAFLFDDNACSQSYSYKAEWVEDSCGKLKEWWNMNYLFIRQPLRSCVANYMQINCHTKLTQQDVEKMLRDLTTKTTSARFLPLLPAGGGGTVTQASALVDIKRIEKYRTTLWKSNACHEYLCPIIIDEGARGWALLIEGLLHSPEMIVAKMLWNLCDEKTRQRQVLTAVPNPRCPLVLQTFEARPRPGRKLTVPNSNFVSVKTKQALRKRIRLESYRQNTTLTSDTINEERVVADYFIENGLGDTDDPDEYKQYTPDGMEKRISAAIAASPESGVEYLINYPNDIIIDAKEQMDRAEAEQKELMLNK
jgi:hypothetical protein